MGEPRLCPRCMQPAARWGCWAPARAVFGPWVCRAPSDPPPKPPAPHPGLLTPRGWYHEQLVRRLGLGKALSMVVAEAERRGAEPVSVVSALVDVLRSYTDREHMPVAELVRLVRDWRPPENG